MAAVAGMTHAAEAKDYKFLLMGALVHPYYGPMPAGVHAGDSIEWVNRDIFEHSVTARDGRFDIDLKPGASMRTTAVAGTTAFFCKFHPGMTGTLVVK